MRDQNEQTSALEGRMLTFKGGGWVIVASAALALIIALYMLRGPILAGLGVIDNPPGDNENVETYGFDLTTNLMDPDVFVPGMPHRDFIRPLDNPTYVPGSEIPDLNRNHPRRKYVVSEDYIVGVSINGEHRAYPIPILYVHEIINDELGGVPIAVTYMFPAGSSVVFDRRPPKGGETLEFAVSGLVYNCNLLMYDRPPAPGKNGDDADSDFAGESLWSQLQARATAGPAAEAGKTLTVLPCSYTTWGQWKERHPDTTVIERGPGTSHRRYKYSEPPPSYTTSDNLMYEVKPMPPGEPGELALKEPVVVVQAGGARRVYPISYIAAQGKPALPNTKTWTDTLAGTQLTFTYHSFFKTVEVQAMPSADTDEPPAISVWYSYWFAWYAMYPEDEVAGQGAG